MPVGRNFLEVVAPKQEGTAGGRYLDRRGGDGGYMVITQGADKATQQAVRQRALDHGVRIAMESQRERWNICQLHPRDMIAPRMEQTPSGASATWGSCSMGDERGRATGEAEGAVCGALPWNYARTPVRMPTVPYASAVGAASPAEGS